MACNLERKNRLATQPNNTRKPRGRTGEDGLNKDTATIPQQKKKCRYRAKAESMILWRGGWVEGGRAEEWTDSMEVQLVKWFLKPPPSLSPISPKLWCSEIHRAEPQVNVWTTEMGVRFLTYEAEGTMDYGMADTDSYQSSNTTAEKNRIKHNNNNSNNHLQRWETSPGGCSSPPQSIFITIIIIIVIIIIWVG